MLLTERNSRSKSDVLTNAAKLRASSRYHFSKVEFI